MGAKQFFKGLSWLLVLNLVIKPLWLFVIDRQVQNMVGHRAYGTYFSLFNLTYILLFVADAGLSNMITQRMAASGRGNTQQLLRLKISLLFFYAVLCTTIAFIAHVSQWRLLGYLIVVQSLTSLFVFLRSLLTARQLFKTDAFFSVLDKSLLLLLCLGPVYGLFRPMTVLLFLQLQTLSGFIAVSVLFILLVKKGLLTRGEKVTRKTILVWMAPFVLILLLMSAHNRLDAFLLERLHPDGAVQAGIYASAYRLLDAASMIGYLAASFLVPFLSRHRQEKVLLQGVILFLRHFLLLCAGCVVAIVFVFAPWLQQVLYHTAHAFDSSVMRLCLAVLPAYYLTHIYGSALTATAHFRLFIKIIFCSVVANVLLNGWLIPTHGALGCCVAALITQYGCGLALWIAASRKLSVSLSAGSLVLCVAASVVFWSLLYYRQQLTGAVWIILSSIALVAFAVIIARRNAIKKMFLLFYK